MIIYGAGATGRDLAHSLLHGNEYHPAAFIDDYAPKSGQILAGVRVYNSCDFAQLQKLYQPVKLLLAINNINKGERLRLLDKVSHWPIEVQSVPSVEDIAAGRADANKIKDLDVSDLLGRAPVDPDLELLKKNIVGKVVLVTGAGGSIGSELCRQIVLQKPHMLILFELNEFNLYQVEQELQNTKLKQGLDTIIVAMLGSVQRKSELAKIMSSFKVQTVYHAAAYKHVPLVESNVVGGIRNNVFGTLASAEAAISAGVEHFTLISTDKAVRPTNIMGATKRMAELVLQSLSTQDHNTKFTIVRFGNVLGSSGSVVPLFKKQIRVGGPVTVTHKDITRYFMLIPEAAQLVIQAGALGGSGQVYVLDMGEPIKILDLAKRMIHLSGLREKDDSMNGDIEIHYTGLRQGEKLYEELLIGGVVEGTSHKKIMTAKEYSLAWEEMKVLLDELILYCDEGMVEEILTLLKKTPTVYMPNK
ncbi:polysaccharide biosynthesis protein [Marinomonas dokdonensis]|uniref:polysaccharide biosynthesis protein n=1 Tax=Marinomonas dokdonensis TaxID=328224 RepID=UPI00405577E4